MGDMVVVDVVDVRVEGVGKFSGWMNLFASIHTIGQILIIDLEGNLLSDCPQDR